MSLQHAAKHLEKHGRNGDTMLVHMSKGEVKSLNDLAMAHGGYLTINPHTGLPEAGFLRKMLPMIAGAALAATGVGAPVAGLIVGGGTAVATGDIKQGLMAGLGAYGGAGLGSALQQSGAQAVASNAVPLPVEAATAAPAAAAPVEVAAAAPAPVATPAPAPVTPVDTTKAVSLDGSPAKPMSMADTAAGNAKYMGEGVKSLATEGGPTRFYENLGNVENTYGAKTTLAAAATPAAYDMYQEQQEENKPEPGDSDPGQQYTYEANATIPTPDTDPFGREKKYFNQQYVARAAEGGFTKGILERIGEAGGGQGGVPAGYSYDADTQQYTKLATGGISDAAYNLGGYSDGGRLLRGPGDGVSDSIPAVIGKKQPARLADGEFVVPARIVSELGNGSTEAGARKLYAMMDRIQKARGKTVGKGKVAKNSRAEKYLPA